MFHPSLFLSLSLRLAKDLMTGNQSSSSPPPYDMSDLLFELMPSVKFDRVPTGCYFGEVTKDALSSYSPGSIVSVEFRSGNPRNNPRPNGTFLKVQQKSIDAKSSHEGFESFTTSWTDVAYDGDWETKFHWRNVVDDPLAFGLSGISLATIEWTIPSGVQGTYRLCHYGDSRKVEAGAIEPFEGCSSEFSVM